MSQPWVNTCLLKLKRYRSMTSDWDIIGVSHLQLTTFGILSNILDGFGEKNKLLVGFLQQILLLFQLLLQSWYVVQLSSHWLHFSTEFRCAILLCTQNFWAEKQEGRTFMFQYLLTLQSYKFGKANSSNMFHWFSTNLCSQRNKRRQQVTHFCKNKSQLLVLLNTLMHTCTTPLRKLSSTPRRNLVLTCSVMETVRLLIQSWSFSYSLEYHFSHIPAAAYFFSILSISGALDIFFYITTRLSCSLYIFIFCLATDLDIWRPSPVKPSTHIQV